ncbi:MAG TPA: pyridoxal phosphate-dependent aminotransferase [Vicinamibacteria bacterium]|nr:pyridoxal phosphate-dependent aminotransferase [Vicinamibacteria bacterium]
MKPEISGRARRMPASPIRKLMPLAEEARRRGRHIYHLNIGQPDLETPEPMRARLGALRDKVLAYTPSGGTPEYLSTLQDYYRGIGIPVGLEDLIATTGGSEALLFAFLACAGEGDEAVVVEPFYTNYSAFATMAGVRLVPLTSRAEDGFHLPPRAAWEKALTARTRLVLLCNPNNPTGTVYRPDELRMVAELCRERRLFLVADEVYREFVYDGGTAVSALSLAGFEDLVVVVDSQSKRYSACGIRLGCLVSRNHDVIESAMKMAQGRLSAPGLAQIAAVGARELGPEYTEGVVTEYQRRRDLLFAGLSRIPGVFLRKPEGAFYFVARLPVDDAEEFARWLLSDFELRGATVMVAPAEGFYATPGLGRDEVRIAYVLKEADLEAAVEILAAALPAYRSARGLAAVPAGGEAVPQPDFSVPAES